MENFAEKFKNTLSPSSVDFEGKYSVKMLTGLMPNFSWLGHRKVFYKDGKSTKGYNVILGWRWGNFVLEKSSNKVVINYNVPQNSFLTRRIYDEVRYTGTGCYLGRFNYLWNNKPRFLGYFSLNRIS